MNPEIFLTVITLPCREGDVISVTSKPGNHWAVFIAIGKSDYQEALSQAQRVTFSFYQTKMKKEGLD